MALTEATMEYLQAIPQFAAAIFRARVFSDTLLNSCSTLYTNMFDFLPLPHLKTSLGNVWMDRKRERFHALPCETRKKAGTACRIDRVWRERRKIKRESVKKRESTIVVCWSIHGEDFFDTWTSVVTSQCIAYLVRRR